MVPYVSPSQCSLAFPISRIILYPCFTRVSLPLLTPPTFPTHLSSLFTPPIALPPLLHSLVPILLLPLLPPPALASTYPLPTTPGLIPSPFFYPPFTFPLSSPLSSLHLRHPPPLYSPLSMFILHYLFFPILLPVSDIHFPTLQLISSSATRHILPSSSILPLPPHLTPSPLPKSLQPLPSPVPPPPPLLVSQLLHHSPPTPASIAFSRRKKWAG